jgi:hypothetical protein
MKPTNKKENSMKTQTEINLATFNQRLKMLTAPPAAPVSGRGNVRVELTDAPEIVDAAMRASTPHVAVVSVRKAVNRFGRLGYPKSVFVSPEFAALFN